METQKMMDWLLKAKKNDELELQNSKKKFIEELKNIKKEDIFKPEPKLTLWQRIKKILNF